MTEPTISTSRQIGEKLTRVSIAAVGLLILHAILSALPMLKSPVIYMPSVTDASPSAGQSFLTPEQIGQWQRAMANAVNSALTGTPQTQNRDFLIQAHLAIFPVTIANAIVDTLIFIVLVLFGRDLGSVVRSRYAKLPDLGQILNLGVITIVVAMAYYSYQGIFYPFLWPDNQDAYGWIFIALGLAPLVGIVVMVSRNMDAITAVVMHSGAKVISIPATSLCAVCGQSAGAGTKFCPNCGVSMNVAAPVPPDRVGQH